MREFRLGKGITRRLRLLGTFVLFGAGIALATASLAPWRAPTSGPRLGFDRLQVVRPYQVIIPKSPFGPNAPDQSVPQRADAPTFGHPVVSGIGGFGFEENVRPDPIDPTHIYTSVPGSA